MREYKADNTTVVQPLADPAAVQKVQPKYVNENEIFKTEITDL